MSCGRVNSASLAGNTWHTFMAERGQLMPGTGPFSQFPCVWALEPRLSGFCITGDWLSQGEAWINTVPGPMSSQPWCAHYFPDTPHQYLLPAYHPLHQMGCCLVQWCLFNNNIFAKKGGKKAQWLVKHTFSHSPLSIRQKGFKMVDLSPLNLKSNLQYKETRLKWF